MCAWTDTMMLAQWLLAEMSACKDAAMQSLCNRPAGALSLGALLAYASIAHAEQYLCVAEKASGFSYDKLTKIWDNFFNISVDVKYLVTESKDSKYAC